MRISSGPPRPNRDEFKTSSLLVMLSWLHPLFCDVKDVVDGVCPHGDVCTHPAANIDAINRKEVMQVLVLGIFMLYHASIVSMIL